MHVCAWPSTHPSSSCLPCLLCAGAYCHKPTHSLLRANDTVSSQTPPPLGLPHAVHGTMMQPCTATRTCSPAAVWQHALAQSVLCGAMAVMTTVFPGAAQSRALASGCGSVVIAAATGPASHTDMLAIILSLLLLPNKCVPYICRCRCRICTVPRLALIHI